MITIVVKATHNDALNDLVRSLISNSEDKNSFCIVVIGEENFQDVVEKYTDSISIKRLLEVPITFSTDLVWSITDEVFVMGYQWDKRLGYYKDKFPDGMIAMLPSGYKAYKERSEWDIIQLAERNPVISGKWANLVGIDDVEMICRYLVLNFDIDRRIDVRLVDLIQRGKISPYVLGNTIEQKAEKIVDYINSFTRSSTLR